MPNREKTIIDKVLDYLYILSKQPILLRDLLDANRQYNEGMHVDPARLGFRLKLGRAYFFIYFNCLSNYSSYFSDNAQTFSKY